MQLITSGTFYRCIRLLQSTAYVHVLVILVLGVIHGTMEYRLPEYNETPSNVTYYKGERAVLQCSVKHLGTKQVIWKKVKDDHVITVGKFVFINEPNFDVDHQPLREEWNLVIRNVQPHHAGIYECQISTKEDLQKYVQLNVIDSQAPNPVGGILLSGKEFVEKGRRIVLTCNATGERQPPEDIDWFKDGTKIKQNQYQGITIVKFRVSETKTLHSELEIEHSDMTDSGNYICRSSDLQITSKNVMVLNGPKIKPRSKNNGFNKGQDYHIAETNPNKRENPEKPKQDQSRASSSAAHPLVSSSRDKLTVYLLCNLAFILPYLSTYH